MRHRIGRRACAAVAVFAAGAALLTACEGGSSGTAGQATADVSPAGDIPDTQAFALRSQNAGFKLGTVTTVNRPAGTAVLITYQADSPPDPVTGKTLTLDVERYEFWQNGMQATITLSAPKGSDNVDPWKTITDSFGWHS